jgi:hypothetical protein
MPNVVAGFSDREALMRWAALVLVGLVVGCQAVPEPPVDAPKRETLGIDYKDWPRVTEKPYKVKPATFMLCAPDGAFPDRGPHTDCAVVVRVNPLGLEYFKSRKPAPVGTVVIKEKHKGNANGPTAVAAMIKREAGYDTDHGDWEYAFEQLQPEGKRKVVRGKLSSCIECHQGTRATDYLFRPYLRVGK